MPTEIVLTPTFGGPHLDELFVSTGRQLLNWQNGEPTNRQLSPMAGTLFKIVGYGAKGYAGRPVRL